MYFSSDWLKQELARITDEEKLLEFKLAFITSASDFLIPDCIQLVQEIYEEGKERRDAGLQAFGLLYISFYDKYKGIKNDEAFEEAERLNQNLEPSFISSIICQMIAFEYWSSGQRDIAFEYTYRSMRISEIIGGEGLGWSSFQLGVFYFDLKDYEKALDYFQRSEQKALDFGLNYQLARIRSGIGSVYIAQNKLEEGARYNALALDGYRECGHQTAISRSLNDLGVISYRLGDPEKAESYLREALEIRTRMNYAPGITTTRMELGRVLMDLQRLDESEKILLDALELCITTRSKQKIAQSHQLLSELYKKKEDPWKALDHFEKYFAVKSEITGEEASNRITFLQQKFATEKSEQETEIHRLKNIDLKKAYDEIDEKNRSILDSINYAQRIQQALLTADDFLQHNLPEHFILFLPKDIVSGDFYWAGQKEDCVFLAACDSTGHGVPGAFMSLLNSSFLNQAVSEKNLSDPNLILDHVRERLLDSISDEGQKDGMDAGLICIRAGADTIRYAAAHNAPLLVREGKTIELEADKMPVGRSEKPQPFSPFSVQVKKGDMLYLFTDGYADQFGGEKGKKFKHKNLIALLREISGEPVSVQKDLLEKKHAGWKGALEQLDDILIIGLRF